MRTNDDIARALEGIAMGNLWDGEALELAANHPAATYWDRMLIRRFQHGTDRGTDHVMLQHFAIIIRDYED